MKQPYSFLWAQYRRFKQLGSWMKKGKLSRFGLKRRQNLERQLGELFKKLQAYVPAPQLVKAAGVSLALMAGINANAQTTFAPSVNNPFGLPNIEDVGFISTADIDDDGDLDMLVSSYYNTDVIYYRNVGSATAPQFDTTEIAMPGLTAMTNYAFGPSFVDLDNDGDLDVMGYQFLSYSTSGFIYQQNNGTASAPSFGSLTTLPFGLVDTTAGYINTGFADMDADGDLDMFSRQAYPNQEMKYYQNTGSVSSPQFAAPVVAPFQIQTTTTSGVMSIGDLDRDGDFDIMIGGIGGDFEFHENTGTAQLASFDAPVTNPFGLVGQTGTYFAFPWLTDIDGDGDLDMFANNDSGTFVFFENQDATVGTTTLEANDLSFQLSPNPAHNIVQLNINAPVEASDVLIQVVGVNGQVVKHSFTNISTGKQVVQVSVSELPAGLYAIRMTFNGTQLSQKFVKAN